MKRLVLTLLLLAPIMTLFGQNSTSKLDPHVYGNGLTVKLNEDGSKYVRFILWHQFWLSGDSESEGLSLSIRRSRVLAFAQFTPRFMVLTHFGLNSLGAQGITANPNTQAGNNSALFLHGAWGDFAVVPKKLHVGAGLHYWNGVSRLSNQSTLNMMTLDNPGSGTGDARLFPWANITTSDQFARHMGVFAKGTINKFSYRVAANNARTNYGTLSSTIPSIQVAGTGEDWLYTGYFNYNFFDGESDKLPYFVGTYLGKKKVFNVGVGFHVQPNAIKKGSLNAAGSPVYSSEESISRLSADVFYDAPVGDKGAALNLYGSVTQHKYGSDDSFSSGGLVPGNGTISYAQAGYLLPGTGSNHQFMPYVTYANYNLKNTPNTSSETGLGLNWYLSGHNAKFTLEHNIGKKGTTGAESTSKTRLQLHVFI